MKPMGDRERVGEEGQATLVVGGGVVGLAIAYELARRGRRVRVVERERPGAGATDASAGMLAPISEAGEQAPSLVELGQKSLRRYPELVARLESETGIACGYRTEGTLWIAVTRDGRAELEHLGATLERGGHSSCFLGADEVRRREPRLSPRLLGGLLVDADHQLDPRALSQSLAAAVRRLGGQITCGVTVTEIVAQGGRVQGIAGRRGTGERFETAAAEVVLAAGAWSCRDLRLPVADPGLRPVKGQLLRLRGERLLDHVVRTREVYLVPRESGELLVGATQEEVGFDESPTAGAVMELLRYAWELCPGIHDLELAELCVGLRPVVEDHLPVIGASEVTGLHLALGHYRSGILLAPITGELLARSIVEGRPMPELEPFRPRRLAAGPATTGA